MEYLEEIKELQNEVQVLKKDYFTLSEKYDDLSEKYNELSEKKNEIYYQKFLEKHLKAKHKKTVYGITDITTEHEHIEIKHWKNYKYALGQLLSYNFNDDKSLCAYFFGQVDPKQLENIIDLYKSKSISIKRFLDTPNGIVIENVLDMTNQTSDSLFNSLSTNKEKFDRWFDENIVYKKGNKISLKDACLLYFGDSSFNIGVKEKSKFKKDMEQRIKKKFMNVNFNCQKTTIEKQSFQGWFNLSFQ